MVVVRLQEHLVMQLLVVRVDGRRGAGGRVWLRRERVVVQEQLETPDVFDGAAKGLHFAEFLLAGRLGDVLAEDGEPLRHLKRSKRHGISGCNKTGNA